MASLLFMVLMQVGNDHFLVVCLAVVLLVIFFVLHAMRDMLASFSLWFAKNCKKVGW